MSQGSTSSVEAFVNDVSPVNAEGQVVCYHRLPAKRLTSHTIANPERDFFVCSKNSNDPEKCKFFTWADNPTLCSVLKAKRETLGMSTPVTPERTTQAQRALSSRSPPLATATSYKRPRTPSPTLGSSHRSDPAGAAKHRRVNDAVSNHARTSGLTPGTVSSQLTGRFTEGQKAPQSERKAALLRTIEDALHGVQAIPRARSPASSRGLQHDDIEDISQFSTSQSLSDISIHPTPSLSQTKQNPRLFPRPTAETQSDAGTSIDTEVELAEIEDMESKAVQTSPIDDESSVIEDFWRTTPPRSVIGSHVTLADVEADTSCAHPDWMPRVPYVSGAERIPWSPAPPQTPRRAGTSRIFTSGGNEGEGNPGMLLTPPGSSQPHPVSEARPGPSTSQRGRALLQEMLASPTASKGKGPEPLDSASKVRQWKMLQDDPENPFRPSTVAHGASSPAPTAISVADGVGGSMAAESLSADSIASHLAVLQSVPEYVAKLERREKAAQKSAEIKGRRLAQLEEEVQRLRNEKRALEETVAALRMRR